MLKAAQDAGASQRAMWSAFAIPPASVKSPPTQTSDPDIAMAHTVLFRFYCSTLHIQTFPTFDAIVL